MARKERHVTPNEEKGGMRFKKRECRKGLSFWVKHGFIDDMPKYPKIFKGNDFKNVLSIFEEILNVENDTKMGDFMLVNYYLPTAIKVTQKHNNPN